MTESDPKRLPDPRAVSGVGYGKLYEVRFPEEERTSKAGVWRVLCDSFFSRYVPENGTVLDLGAGYCDFSNHIRAARRIAVDLNPDMPKCAAPGIETHLLPLECIGDVVEPGSVDLAFASNVFEHLRSPDVLIEVLGAVSVALKPGGRLVVVQPNIRLVGASFWDFFDHTLPLTEKGMAEGMAAVGLSIEECRARFLPYTTKSRLPRAPFFVGLYLAFPPAQWLLGKQMLVVGRREK